MGFYSEVTKYQHRKEDKKARCQKSKTVSDFSKKKKKSECTHKDASL